MQTTGMLRIEEKARHDLFDRMAIQASWRYQRTSEFSVVQLHEDWESPELVDHAKAYHRLLELLRPDELVALQRDLTTKANSNRVELDRLRDYDPDYYEIERTKQKIYEETLKHFGLLEYNSSINHVEASYGG